MEENDVDDIHNSIQCFFGFKNVYFPEKYDKNETNISGKVHANTFVLSIETFNPYSGFLDAKIGDEFVLLWDNR